MKLTEVKLADLVPDPKNARLHNERNITEIKRSLEEFGQHRPFVVRRNTNIVIIGNGMLEAMLELGWEKAYAYYVDDDDVQVVRRALADNRTAELAEWDENILQDLLAEFGSDESIPGWDDGDINSFSPHVDPDPEDTNKLTLAARFGVPPFSVLNSREGLWQTRKKAWINLGIRSELGRADIGTQSARKTGGLLFKSMTINPAYYRQKEKTEKQLKRKLSDDEFRENYYIPNNEGANAGTSIFDPVLCELAYRWFSCEGDVVLDPFAGGSVRGVVGSRLGRQYVGVELRKEQVEANLDQLNICGQPNPRWIVGDSMNINSLTDNVQADMILTCPPYADLEVYSDLPEDISNMPYKDFLPTYRSIINKTCAQLKQDRFAFIVVGEVRDRKGNYYGFVPDTIQAFLDCGLSLYNEAILVNAVVSGRLRAARPFESSRKLCKMHQNVLIFCKGNAKEATKRLGACEFGEIESLEDYTE